MRFSVKKLRENAFFFGLTICIVAAAAVQYRYNRAGNSPINETEQGEKTMRITENFKTKAAKAKADGYERVYSLGGSYYATDYCSTWPIDWLLKQPIGSSVRAFRAQNGERWEGHQNTRDLSPTDIKYSVLMALY